MKDNDEIAELDTKIRELSKNARDDAYRSIIYTADVINQFVSTRVSREEYTRISISILFTLITHGGSLNLTDICKFVFRSKYAVTRVVDTLVKHKYVRRMPVKGDRRMKKVVITEKGVDLIQKSMQDRIQIASEVTSYLKDNELPMVLDVLHNLRKHLLSKIKSYQTKK